MSVVVDINKVGLVIWGVQSGHRVFCHNSAISDPNLPEIKATWGDIRNLVVVNNLSVVFYALEFSMNYKVFTVYRPVNDFGRSGGYVAVTIYVPHHFKLQNIRGLLDSISQAYLSDHYSFGEPLNTPETIGRYQQMLIAQSDSLALDDEFRRWQESEQNHLTKLLPFNDPSVVDHFFATPYREDFGPYQEIMFWNLNYLQNPAQFGVTFLRELSRFELNGTDVSEEYKGDRISALTGLTLRFFKKNGVDCKDSYQQKGFYGPSRIAFELVKNEYSQPISFDGTVDEAVQRGFLLKTGKSYSWRSGIRFEPKSFQLSVSFVGLEGVSGFLKAGLDQKSLYEVRDGRLDLELKGEEVQYQKTLYIDEFGLKRKVRSFVPEELTQFAGRYLLEVNSLRFVPLSFVGENAELPSRLSFGVRGFDGMATLDPKAVNGLVLSEDQNLSDIEISVDKYESRIDDNRIVLKKTHVLVRIILPSILESSFRSSGVIFGLRSNSGELKRFNGLAAEIRYDDLPKDGAFKLCLFPNVKDDNVIFPFNDLLVQEKEGEILIKPRLMKVNNPERIEFWQGSPTVQRRLWVCHDQKCYQFIPEATEFASEDEDFGMEIDKKEGFSVLNVKGKRVVTPVDNYSDLKVGEVFLSKEGTDSHATIHVYERDKCSDGVYQVKLSREKNLYCSLPFPYDDNKYDKLQKSFDPRLKVNPTAANAYNILVRDEIKSGKPAGKSGVHSGGRSGIKKDVQSGRGKSQSVKREKNTIELPSWLIYVIGGVALLALLLGLWFVFLYPGRKQGEISFELENHQYKDNLGITITKNPKYTKAHENVLTIYKKYEKGENNGTINGVELSFGNKFGGKYSDGVLFIDGNTNKKYLLTDNKKEICSIKEKEIPSLCELEEAVTLPGISAVLEKYKKSVLIKDKAIEKAKSLVTDKETLNDYEKYFGRIDTSKFVENTRHEFDVNAQKMEAITNAKKELKKKFDAVHSMSCTVRTVTDLEYCLSSVFNLGVSETDVNNLCGKNCKETIRYYKAFFNSLDHDNIDTFKRKLGINNGSSQILNAYFGPEQKDFILRKLLKGSTEYKLGQALYKGEYIKVGIPRQASFAELNNRM